MSFGKRGKPPDDLPVHRGAFRIQLVPRVDGRRMHVFNRADGMDGAAGLAMGAVDALSDSLILSTTAPRRASGKTSLQLHKPCQDFRSCMQCVRLAFRVLMGTPFRAGTPKDVVVRGSPTAPRL